MKIDRLKYILKIAECGSIGKAAKELSLSQPTLTKAISSVEEKYNIIIFYRTPSGVNLTKDGRDFINCANQIIYNFNLLDELFHPSKTNNKLELSVSFQQLDFIYDLILDLYKKHEDDFVEFDFKCCNRGDVFSAVKNGETNIGVLIKSPYDSKAFDLSLSSNDLEFEVLSRSDLFVYLGRNSPLYNSDNLSLAECRDYPTLCLDLDKITRNELKLHKKFIYKPDTNIIFTDSIGLSISILENTNMILYSHKWVKNLFNNTHIKTKTTTDGFLENNYEVIYIKRKNEPLSQIEYDFIDSLKNLFKNDLQEK